ncbi:alpha/beta fold hydrolase [Paracoccus sp. CPCC 101403]|uniref:Alpha/beta fold hydrolase n=1 Tax=Paracoccus broussonetiae TaxID=3075834 RepID=A0ABU3EJ89_9RHOB|nr:alpha/beta fold hydrolase [Paracoccus sp. CPCC 101403]MDT1064317.1 alpha/beta fold hydrolase [Paracoccus sp. CPCC 101403]
MKNSSLSQSSDRFRALACWRRRAGSASLILLMALSGCAARPGPETLQPVVQPAGGPAPITLFAVTDRAPGAGTPPVPGSGRGDASYEQLMFQPRPKPAQKDGKVSGPDADPSKDFVTTGRRLMSAPAFDAEVARLARSRDKTIMVFVHGYNYNYQEAVFRVAQLSAETGEGAVPILFSWPSDARATGYLADRDGATYARDDLARLLIRLSEGHGERQIAVVGHSMGAWLVMETLRQLRLQGRGDVVDPLRVVLAAPDIDMDVFRRQSEVVGPLRTPMAVLVSSDDRVLGVSGSLSGGRLRVGNAPLNDPRLLAVAEQNGMRIFDITAVPATDALNHDRYIGFAARYAAAAEDHHGGGLRRAGTYLLDATGRILSSPFDAASRALGGS